jgi:hypothetical protein
MTLHDRLEDARQRECWNNETWPLLRFGYPHRKKIDRPSLFITDSSGTRLLTVDDCLPAWERMARAALDDAG